jgi:hypothetical protein
MSDLQKLLEEYAKTTSHLKEKKTSVATPPEDQLSGEELKGMSGWLQMQKILFYFAVVIIGLEVAFLHLALLMIFTGGAAILVGSFSLSIPAVTVPTEVTIALIIAVYGQVLLTLRSLAAKIFIQFKRSGNN